MTCGGCWMATPRQAAFPPAGSPAATPRLAAAPGAAALLATVRPRQQAPLTIVLVRSCGSTLRGEVPLDMLDGGLSG